MKLKFIGVGAAFNVWQGNTAAYIKEEDTLLLLDCGSSVFASLIEKGLLHGVNHLYIAITHTHSDHIGSLGDLVAYCYHILNVKPKLLNNGLRLDEYLEIVGILKSRYDYFDGTIPTLNLKITSIPARHKWLYKDMDDAVSEQPGGQLVFKSTSFEIEALDGLWRIFYSGDCYALPFERLKKRSFDAYYIDTCLADFDGNGHYNVERLAEDITAAGLDKSKVYCMHLDSDELPSRAKELGFNVVEIEKE